MTRGLLLPPIAILLTSCLLPAPKITPAMDLDFGPMLQPSAQPRRPVPDPEHRESIRPSELAEKLEVGDTASVTTTWQNTYVFRVYRVDEDSFAGVARNDKKYKVPYDNITRVVVRRWKNSEELAFEFLMCNAGICK